MPVLFARTALTLLLLCLIPALGAVTNEKISASFQKQGGEAGFILRKQESGDHYQVRLRNDQLEFRKVKGQTKELLGTKKIPAGLAYRDGQQWTFSAAASGNMISGVLINNSGVEITSGTVFDSTFTVGESGVAESPGVTWSSPVITKLPQYITAPDNLQDSYDVIIAGAGTAGSMAAVQAARLGSKVLVIEESDWIGGQMAAAAVTSMDEGAEYPPYGVDRNSVRERGLYREFFNFATHLYDTIGLSTDTCYVGANHFALEPATAQALLHEMFQRERMAGAVLDVTLETSVTKVLKSGNKVTGVELIVNTPEGAAARTIASKILIDATEYGDILPLAGIPYRVGNWTSDNINMAAAEFPPIQDYTWAAVIEHYPNGAPSNLMMTVPPKGYNKEEFEIALDNPEPTSSTNPWSWQRFIGYRGMPNSDRPDPTIKNPWAPVTKTHMNIGANDAHMDVRDIENLDSRMHKEYLLKLSTLKLLYYIQNDMTEPITTWTVALNEGFDTPYNREQNRQLISRYPDLAPYEDILNQFPPIPYARESRRMIGVHTIRAREIDRRTGPMIFPTSVAVGDYAVDLHGADSPEVLELELDNPEDLGAIGFAGNQVGPFNIPFEAFIPETADGFLPAEKNISQSRLVNGATRLQPSTMLMGQAAGAIAGLAVAQDVNPRDLHPTAVQKVLLDAGDTLYAARYDAHKLPGVALDTDLWDSLQFCLLYGIVHLSDAQQHLSGLEILSGAIGASGWKVNNADNLQFSGVTTGLATYQVPLHDGTTSASESDYSVTATFARSGGSGTVGVVGRLKDKNNFYHARLYARNLELYKWEDGKAISMASAPVDYENGSSWTISLQFDDDNISASLRNYQGEIQNKVAVNDSSHASGLVGLRVQPGAGHFVEIASFEVQPAGSSSGASYQAEFHKPINFATDPLTRGQFAIHLARYLDLPTTALVAKQSYADVAITHPALPAVESLRRAGINLTGDSAGSRFQPSAVVTRADIAVAIASALKLPLEQAPEKPYYSDVPPSHPAFRSVQLLAQNQIAKGSLLTGSDTFSPAHELTMADSLHFFADLLVNPPAGSEKIVPSRTKPRPAH